MPHPHHGHPHRPSGSTLYYALAVTAAFALVEAIGGWWAGSLALLADAGHMFTDSASLAIGVFAACLARLPASGRHSFGLQRAEVLGALANVLLMFALVAALALGAIGRLLDPAGAAVDGGLVLIVAAIGLLVNLVVAAVLLRGEQTMNVRGALLHVVGDLFGSLAALAAGAVIVFTGWMPIDPILSLFVGLLILVSAARLLREVLRVLLEGVPRDVDAAKVQAALVAVAGVNSVHDLHIWTLSSSSYALAAHVDVDALHGWRDILPRLQAVLRERFGIAHSTLQPEDAEVRHNCDADPGCGAAPLDEGSQ